MKPFAAFLFLCCLVFFAGKTAGQAKPAAKSKTVVFSLKQLVSATAFPFKMINENLASIPFTGSHIKDYNVMVQTTGDLVIVITPLSDIMPAKMAEYNYLTMLQRSQYYDLVKIVADEAGYFYLRVDTYKTLLNATVLKRIIQQVGNVTDLLYDELK